MKLMKVHVSATDLLASKNLHLFPGQRSPDYLVRARKFCRNPDFILFLIKKTHECSTVRLNFACNFQCMSCL
jgi:hypothetical protein